VAQAQHADDDLNRDEHDDDELEEFAARDLRLIDEIVVDVAHCVQLAFDGSLPYLRPRRDAMAR